MNKPTEIRKPIIAIDASISSPAFAIFDPNSGSTEIYCLTSKYSKPLYIEQGKIQLNIAPQKELYVKKPEDDFLRYMQVVTALCDCLNHKTNYIEGCQVYLEGYSFASTGMTFNIGEFGGLLKGNLYQKKHILNIVPPGTWKKAIVGKGNAKKDQIYEFCLQSDEFKPILEDLKVNYGIVWKKSHWIEDVCDVWCLLEYAIDQEVLPIASDMHKAYGDLTRFYTEV